ncbi:hypothetical protein A2T98_04195 [Nodularia spumigena CENA596]|uniref:Uncharacterized protein n=1 Tax=Nodularia spumigena CENA596 TaxID=1819295 RepID=A0A166KGB3_NODSP|nr:hypothetical protein A2T98_04195 [Nodularia spumigena CENA596]
MANLEDITRNQAYQNSYKVDVKVTGVAYRYSYEIALTVANGQIFFSNQSTKKQNIKTIKPSQ